MENKLSKLKVESGFQLFTRVTPRPTLGSLHPAFFPQGGPHLNAVLQITGAPSTGKTLLLTELAARCILPQNHLGNGCGAILVNTDHHFSIFRLIATMEPLIDQPQRAKEVIEGSLKNLFVLNCYSSEQTRLTLRNLERVLADNEGIGLLLVDGILAHYWYDRSTNGRTSMNAHTLSALSEIKNVIGDRSVITVFTKAESDKPLYYNVNYTVHLQRDPDEGFTATMHDHDANTKFKKRYKIGSVFTFVD